MYKMQAFRDSSARKSIKTFSRARSMHRKRYPKKTTKSSKRNARVIVLSELYIVARTLVRGGFFLFLGMTFFNIIMAPTSILVARIIAPKDCGFYTVIMILQYFLIALSDFGISLCSREKLPSVKALRVML